MRSCFRAFMTDIDKRFSESNWIFYTIFLQFQVLLLGIPMLVALNNSSANASYLGKTLIIFVIVLTTLLFMFGPKAIALWRLHFERHEHNNGSWSRPRRPGRYEGSGLAHVRVSGYGMENARNVTRSRSTSSRHDGSSILAY